MKPHENRKAAGGRQVADGVALFGFRESPAVTVVEGCRRLILVFGFIVAIGLSGGTTTAQEQPPVNRETQSALEGAKHVRNLTLAEEAKLKEATRKILCACPDCPPTLLDDCICPTARQFKDGLKEGLLAGVAPDVLARQYIAEHGEKYLAAPPNAGFNRLIWVFPALAFVGLSLLFWFGIQRLTRKRTETVPVAAAPAQGIGRYEAEIEKELNRRKG